MNFGDYFTDSGVFEDREEAGRKLAPLLFHLRPENPVVLALPRGGVEVGYYVARELNAPLDVIVARKLGAPGQEELGIGAIAPGGVRIVDDYAVRYLGITPEKIDQIAQREAEEMERRLRLYRGDRPTLALHDRTVILVDDGLATGVSARAAIRSVQQQDPRRVVLAVPVCAGDTAQSIRDEGVEVLCVNTPSQFRAVGYWYRDFRQLTDQEVIDLLRRAEMERTGSTAGEAAKCEEGGPVHINAGGVLLEGDLTVPANAKGVVLFAHGSGSSRHSPRNRFVAEELQKAGMGTLLMDLLTVREEEQDARTGHLRFDIPFLANRLLSAIDWLRQEPLTQNLPIGCFGASTGAGAALVAAADRREAVKAVVSRGGRPDMAEEALARVEAPTLLIVGGDDTPVIALNQQALARLRSPQKELVIVPNASHLFPEPGALEEVARLASEWFTRYLTAGTMTKAA
jgi:putative phosphoribosyl transferase